MLMPKRVKRRRVHRGRMKVRPTKETLSHTVIDGHYSHRVWMDNFKSD